MKATVLAKNCTFKLFYVYGTVWQTPVLSQESAIPLFLYLYTLFRLIYLLLLLISGMQFANINVVPLHLYVSIIQQIYG
jgi:hypothetical protein